MNILLAGVFSPASTNVPMADEFERLGHSVSRFPYREAAARAGPFGLQGLLLRASESHDVVIVCKGLGGGVPGFERPTLEGLSCKSVYWLPDSTDVQGLPVINLALGCDIACATSLVSCNALTRWGHPNVNQIFEGFDPEVWKPRPKIERKYDVTFVGSVDPHREKMLLALESAGIVVQRPVSWMRDLSCCYNRSRIVLNVCRGEIFSDRVVQGMASGAYVLSKYCQDLEAFDVGTELGVYHVWNELVDKTRIALADDERREQIAKAGHEAVQVFTWAKQIQKLVDVIKGGSVRDGAYCG